MMEDAKCSACTKETLGGIYSRDGIKLCAECAEEWDRESGPPKAGGEGMSDRERLIREGFCFDSNRDCDAAKYLIGVIDVIRGDRSRMRGEAAEKDASFQDTIRRLRTELNEAIDKRDSLEDLVAEKDASRKGADQAVEDFLKRLYHKLVAINAESVPAGSDFGNSTVARLSQEAIDLYRMWEVDGAPPPDPKDAKIAALRKLCDEQAHENARLEAELKEAHSQHLHGVLAEQQENQELRGKIVRLERIIEELREALSRSNQATVKIARLEEACGWAYQFGGARNATEMMLDNLSALANGKPAPHEWEVVGPDDRWDKINRLEAEFKEVAAQSERFRQWGIAAQEQTRLVAEAKDAEISRLERIEEAARGLNASCQALLSSHHLSLRSKKEAVRAKALEWIAAYRKAAS